MGSGMCIVAFLCLFFSSAAALQCSLPFDDSTDEIVCNDWQLVAGAECGTFVGVPWCTTTPCLRFWNIGDNACFAVNIDTDGDDLAVDIALQKQINATIDVYLVYEGIPYSSGNPWTGHLEILDSQVGEYDNNTAPIPLPMSLFGDVYGDVLNGTRQVCVQNIATAEMTVTSFGMKYTAPSCPSRSKSKSKSKRSRSKSTSKRSRSKSTSQKSRSRSISKQSRSKSTSQKSRSKSTSKRSASKSQSQSQTPECDLLLSPYRRGSAVASTATPCGRAVAVYPSDNPIGYQPFSGVTIAPASGGNISHIELDYNGTTPIIVWSPSCDILVPVATNVAFVPGACGTTRMIADLVSPVAAISVLFPGGGNATILLPAGFCSGPAVSCQCAACGE